MCMYVWSVACGGGMDTECLHATGWKAQSDVSLCCQTLIDDELTPSDPHSCVRRKRRALGQLCAHVTENQKENKSNSSPLKKKKEEKKNPAELRFFNGFQVNT